MKKLNKSQGRFFTPRDSGCECAHYSTTSHSLAPLFQWQKQQRVAVGCVVCGLRVHHVHHITPNDLESRPAFLAHFACHEYCNKITSTCRPFISAGDLFMCERPRHSTLLLVGNSLVIRGKYSPYWFKIVRNCCGNASVNFNVCAGNNQMRP